MVSFLTGHTPGGVTSRVVRRLMVPAGDSRDQGGLCMARLAERITVDPEQCGGRPCVRGMRIRVTAVLDLLANGLTPAQVLENLPDLEPEDIPACLRFASRRLSHPVVVA